MPPVDQNAKNIHGDTPLKCALFRSFSSAESLYDLLPPQNRSNLNAYRLLSIIVGDPFHDADYKSKMAKRIIDDLTFEPVNARSSPYNVTVDCYLQAFDDEEEDTAKQMWELLNDRLVPLRYFDDHSTTPIAHAIKKAPPVFLKDPADSFSLNEEEIWTYFRLLKNKSSERVEWSLQSILLFTRIIVQQ